MNDGDASSTRTRLIELLEVRGRLLSPSEETISRALRRCVRYDIRTQRRVSVRVPAVAPATEEEAAQAPAADAAAGDDDLPSDDVDAPIATAVAQANTVSDSVQAAMPPRPVTVAENASRQTTRRRNKRLDAGRVIGGYRIEGLLGTGGMGQVYRATQLSMNRQVALKVLSPRFTENTRFRERFLREARFAGRLQHPNLIAVHDVGESDGLLYFSMELVEGSNARDLLGTCEGGRMDDERVFAIAEQACEALRYAHGHGVIHRDVKPDNLMITAAGMVKLADLGLSRSEQEGEDEDFTTKTGTMMGTPYYMPPEQGRDAHRADQRADLYSLGASLYHLSCGHVPFEGETAVAILINASTQPLRFSEPGPGPQLRGFIETLMAKKPEHRPASAGEALELLRRIRTGKTVRISPRAGVPEAAPAGAALPAPRRRRRWWLMLVVVALGGAAAFAARHLDPDRAVKDRIADLVAHHRFDVALGEIDLARERGSGAWLDAVQEGTIAAWDAWALAEAAAGFATVEAAIAARDFVSAEQQLTAIERSEAWRSPAVLAEIDRLDQRLSEAALRQGSVEERRRMADYLAGRWLAAVFGPKAEVSPGQISLKGTERVRLASFQHMPRSMPVVIQLQIQPGPGQHLSFASGATTLRVDERGYVMDRGDSTQVLVPAGETGVTLILSRRGDAVFLESGEHGHRLDGNEVIVSWDGAADGLTMSFQLQRLQRNSDPR